MMITKMSKRTPLFAILLCAIILIPPYYKLFGYNALYMYSIGMVILYAVFKGGKIAKPYFFTNLYFIYCLYTIALMTIRQGAIYGLATATTTIGVYYITSSFIKSKATFERVIDVIITAGIYLCVLGVIEEIIQFNFIKELAPVDSGLNFMDSVRSGIYRIQTIFAQPVVHGWFMVLLSGIILYKVSIESNNRKYLFAYILCCMNELFAFSRGPLFTFILLQFILLIKMKVISFKRKYFIRILVLVMIFGFVLLFSQGLRNAISEVYNSFALIFQDTGGNEGTYSGFGDRLDLFIWVPIKMQGKWLLGNSEAFAYQMNEWATKHSIENEYLNCLYNYGIVGLISMIGGYLAIIFKLSKHKMSQLYEGKLSFCGFMFYTLVVFFVFIFWETMSSAHLLFMLILGLCGAEIKLSTSK